MAAGGAQAAFQPALQDIAVGAGQKLPGSGQSPSIASGGPSQTLGFDFTPKVPITVESLGVFQVSGGPSILGQQVELIDVTKGGIVLASTVATVAVVNSFNYTGIAPVTLNTTDTYSVISLFSAKSLHQYATGTSVSSADIQLDTLPNSTFTSGYVHGPTIAPITTGYPNLLATNFLYSTVVVPEPASLALFGLGLAGVVLFRRKAAKVVA